MYPDRHHISRSIPSPIQAREDSNEQSLREEREEDLCAGGLREERNEDLYAGIEGGEEGGSVCWGLREKKEDLRSLRDDGGGLRRDDGGGRLRRAGEDAEKKASQGSMRVLRRRKTLENDFEKATRFLYTDLELEMKPTAVDLNK